jgi:2-polyprenyl-3-methyl-5-hydroxy-6-metoxy-1,4-benzoquinol methylase
MSLPSSVQDFSDISDSLRAEILSWYDRRGQELEGRAGWNTLETNSGFAERRGRPLEEMVEERLGIASLEGLRLVDLGCGFGALSVLFAAHGARVTALDPNRERFEVARAVAERHGFEIGFVQGRMRAIPLDTASFDVAVQNNSLCYVTSPEERRESLAETARVLRPGGVLVARNPNRWHPVDQFSRLPLVQMLPPGAAVAVAAWLGRKRSNALAVSPLQMRRELADSGFVGIVHHRHRERRGPDILKLVARYQHFSALRSDVRLAPASE